MLQNLTLTSIFWIVLGFCLIGFGSYFGYSRRMMLYYVLPLIIGLVFLGIGSILSGLTNGFTDYSRNGRLLWKFGAFFLIVGILLTIYGGYKFI